MLEGLRHVAHGLCQRRNCDFLPIAKIHQIGQVRVEDLLMLAHVLAVGRMQYLERHTAYTCNK